MKMTMGIFSGSNEFIAFISTVEISINANHIIYQDIKQFINMDKDVCDILLIDYDTTKRLGLELTSMEYFNDTIMIFVTSQPLIHLQQGYKIAIKNKPVRFVYRPQLSIEISKIVCEELHTIKTGYITVKMNKDLYKLYFHEIYAIYPDDHYLTIMVVNKEEAIRARMWIKEIAVRLLENGFVIVDRSTYINIHYIKCIDYSNKTIYFINGEHTKFVSKHYKEIAKRFLEEV